MKVCKLCEEQAEYWENKVSKPECAFTNGVFSSENWNCGTMNALRQRSYELETDFRDDMAAASIGYVPYDDFHDDELGGYIVMTWYKNRGRTYNAMLLYDNEPIREVTEQIALDALYYSKDFVKEKDN